MVVKNPPGRFDHFVDNFNHVVAVQHQAIIRKIAQNCCTTTYKISAHAWLESLEH